MSTAGTAPTQPRSRERPRVLLVLALVGCVTLLVSAVLALGVGSVPVSPHAVVDVVLQRMGADVPAEVLADRIVWDLRMPRVLGAAATGTALAGCGAVLQSLTRNDLADPYLLGIASGAQAGAVSVIVLGVGVGGLAGAAALTVAGFAGALAALIAVLALAAGRSGELSPVRVVLAGVVVAYVSSAYSSLVVLAGDGDAARRVLSWTLGSFAGIRWTSAAVLVVVALLSVVAFVAVADALDAFAFGESAARSLGVPVSAMRWALMVATALVTAGVVAQVGAIGFVGLVVPHVARLLVGPRHRLLLPASALIGAILMVWADTVARSVVEGSEVPVGVITALVGAPFFAWLLRRGSGQGVAG